MKMKMLQLHCILEMEVWREKKTCIFISFDLDWSLYITYVYGNQVCKYIQHK